MTDVLDLEVLADVLGRHHSAMTPQEFADIFEEVASVSTQPLTAAEHDFLVHGGVDRQLLSDEAQAAAMASFAVDTARANAETARRSFSTGQVADLLGTAASNVRRSAANRDLYTAGRGRNRGHLFPTWQFDGDRPLPHLREVLAVLPADLHPLDVEHLMTTPHEALNGRSPVAWLSGGGDSDVVVRLADELGYT